MESKKNNGNLYTPDEELQQSKPVPVADRTYFAFNDLKKDQEKQGSFVIRNIGGSYTDMEFFIPDDEKFIEIIQSGRLDENQAERLPLKITFKAKALDWSKNYTNTIVIKLDDQDERVVIELDTQTKPVNDFASIFSRAEIKKMTALIERLEKATTAEIAVLTIDSLEGKTIDKYANDLFNEWGIGKENINNGILFIIDPKDKVFRVEVGLGLEQAVTRDFIQELFAKYAVKYFSQDKFGYGAYLILSELFAEVYRFYKNT